MAYFPMRVEETSDGSRFWVSDDGDLYVRREMYEMGEGRSVYKVEIRPGMRVLDLGAHKGFFSVWAARQGAYVEAYEADPQVFGVLKSNLALNGLGKDRVEPICKAISGKQGCALLYCDDRNSSGSSLEEKRVDYNRRMQVDCVTLDQALRSAEWDILKMDIEGSEHAAIESSESLGQVAAIALEWHGAELLGDTYSRLSRHFDMSPIDMSWHILTGTRKKN